MARIPAYLLIRRKSDSSPVRYATAGRIGGRRGGERRCLSKRQALEPSMLRRGGLRESTRDTGEPGVSFEVDERPNRRGRRLIRDASRPRASRCCENRSGSRSLLPGSSVPHECAPPCVPVCTCVRAPYTRPCLFERTRAYVCAASRECRWCSPRCVRRVARPCCATAILSRMLNARYHRVHARVHAGIFFLPCAATKSTTTGTDGGRDTAVVFLGIRMLSEQRRLFAHGHTRLVHTRSAREREGESHAHSRHAWDAHACARCEDRRSSAASSCPPPPLRSPSPPPASISLSFSRRRRSLPSSRSFPPLSPSRVGLPHGQRIRKRGYTRWINFIGALSLFAGPPSPLRRRLYRYCSLLCFALFYSVPFRTPCIAPRWRRVLDKCSPPPQGNAIPSTRRKSLLIPETWRTHPVSRTPRRFLSSIKLHRTSCVTFICAPRSYILFFCSWNDTRGARKKNESRKIAWKDEALVYLTNIVLVNLHLYRILQAISRIHGVI